MDFVSIPITIYPDITDVLLGVSLLAASLFLSEKAVYLLSPTESSRMIPVTRFASSKKDEEDVADEQ